MLVNNINKFKRVKTANKVKNRFVSNMEKVKRIWPPRTDNISH